MLRHSQHGLTLIELMISLTISAILVAASLQVFLIVKQLLMTQQALARIQENGRIVGDLLGRAIRSSGNIGCSALNEYITLKVHGGISSQQYGLTRTDRAIKITLEELKNNPLISQNVLERISPDSDILWIKSVKMQYPLMQPTMGKESFLIIQGQPRLHGGEIITISDCHQVDIVKNLREIELISHQNLSKIFIADPQHTFTLSKYYAENATVGIISSTLYYIGDTFRKNSNNDPIFALYSTDLNGRTLELVEGVEYLLVDYGIKNNSVTTIKLSILLTSIEDGLRYVKPFNINNREITPQDRVLRLWWQFEWPIKGLS